MNLGSVALMGALYAPIQAVLSAQTLTVPNKIASGASIAQYISGSSGLDGPKVSPEINATSFDWWYFDAVAEDASMGIVVVFYLSSDLGFPFVPPLSAFSVDIFAAFEDGSLVFLPQNSLPLQAGSATITTDGDGASGVWKGTGFEFSGTPDLSSYTVIIDSPLLGISGTLELKSVRVRFVTSVYSIRIFANEASLQVAPAHYACGLNQPGQKLELSPHVGWANAIPDADAVANFTVLSRPLQFKGPGYHDKVRKFHYYYSRCK
jgi:hypothetical protein